MGEQVESKEQPRKREEHVGGPEAGKERPTEQESREQGWGEMVREEAGGWAWGQGQSSLSQPCRKPSA